MLLDDYTCQFLSKHYFLLNFFVKIHSCIVKIQFCAAVPKLESNLNKVWHDPSKPNLKIYISVTMLLYRSQNHCDCQAELRSNICHFCKINLAFSWRNHCLSSVLMAFTIYITTRLLIGKTIAWFHLIILWLRLKYAVIVLFPFPSFSRRCDVFLMNLRKHNPNPV